jgi:hypothetical protein
VHRAGSSALGWASNSKQILRSLDRLEECFKECFDRRPPPLKLTAIATAAGPACFTQCTPNARAPRQPLTKGVLFCQLGSPCDRTEERNLETESRSRLRHGHVNLRQICDEPYG